MVVNGLLRIFCGAKRNCTITPQPRQPQTSHSECKDRCKELRKKEIFAKSNSGNADLIWADRPNGRIMETARRGGQVSGAVALAARGTQSGGVAMANPMPRPNPTGSHSYPGLDARWPATVLWRDSDPAIRTITTTDVWHALAEGVDDFRAMPTHVFFACVIYPLVGIVLARLLFGYELLPLIYPMAAGFALLGPFVAIGLYELSRRREQGLDFSPARAFDVFHRPGIDAIFGLGAILALIFVVWLYTANVMYAQIMGSPPSSLSDFTNQVMGTEKGAQLMIAGNLVGFLFALFVLMISVVSFPMLVDRDVSMGTAVRTSVRAALENPGPIALWGLIVVAGLVLGALPFLIGLAIVLPILGHATWHLYRKLVATE
jgi:uncharacterized membrane protein